MAIRRPAIASPEWLFQDFLYQETPDGEDRFVRVKWDGEVYERVSQTFDYSSPPYPRYAERGGDIVAQLDYTKESGLITITNWSINWQDEWPLRLAVNYLINCLYPASRNYVIRVVGDEVYNQAGEAIPVAGKDPYAFWASEHFSPLTNEPYDYLLR